MELQRIVFVLRRRALPILLVGLLAAGAAYAFASGLPKSYEAKATLIVGQSLTSANPDYNDLLASQRLSLTYASVATMRTTLEHVIDSLGLDVTYEQLKSRITADAPRDSTLINIRATDESPGLAAAIANAVAGETIAQSPAVQGQAADTQAFVTAQLNELRTQIQVIHDEINRLSQLSTRTSDQDQRLDSLENRMSQARATYIAMLQSASGSSANVITLADPAVQPSAPSGPRVALLTSLAAVAGLLLAAGIALLRDYFDDRIQSPDDAQAIAGLATLGTIGRMGYTKDRQDSITMWQSPHTPAAEAFRTLRTNLGFSNVDQQLRVVLVTSAMPSEGKTTVASNLAIAFAQAGKRAYLLDADLRRPGIHPTFTVPNGMGLSTLLRAEQLTPLSPIHVAHQVDNGLRVITTGPLPPNPAELLDSQRMKDLLRILRDDSDLVILDSPPILAATDAAVLASIVDGTIIVIDASSTSGAAVARARDALDAVGARVLGAVLNKATQRAGTYDYQYYYSTGSTESAARVDH